MEAKSPKVLASLGWKMLKKFSCSNCDYVGRSKTFYKRKASDSDSWVLMPPYPWSLKYLLRTTSKYKGCPKCGKPLDVPEETPKC